MKCPITISTLLVIVGIVCELSAQQTAIRTTAVSAPSHSPIWFFIASDEASGGGFGTGQQKAAIVNSSETVYIDLGAESSVQNVEVVSARVVTDPNGKPSIEVEFTKSSQDRIKFLTANNIGKRLAVFVDNEVICAPVIRGEISSPVVITGNFSQEEVMSLARIILPPPFQAQLLRIKSDWAAGVHAQAIEAELRTAMKDVSIPKALLDDFPASAPEVLFPPKIISCYTPEHFAELLTWLKENELLLSVESFPPCEFVPRHIAGSESSIYADAYRPIQATNLVRSVEFLGDGFTLLGRSETAAPFVTLTPVLSWHIAESHGSVGKRLIFQRRAYVQEERRGQTPRVSPELDECLFDGVIPANQVTIMNAFPDDSEAEYRDAARQLGFIPLIVSVPLSNEESPAADKGKVRPPDIVETMKTVFTDHRLIGEDDLATHSGTVSSGYGPATDKPSETQSVEVFSLKFGDAASIASILKQLLRDDALVTVEPRTNRFIFSGSREALDEVRKLIRLLDADPDARLDNANVPRSKSIPSPEEIDQARKEYETSERNAFQTASEIRRLTETARAKKQSLFNIAAMQDNLRLQVSRSFRSRQALQEVELAVLEAQLQQARETIAMRNRIEDQIVERRVADLLNPNIEWDSSLLPERDRRHAKPGPDATDSLAEQVESEFAEHERTWTALSGSWVLDRTKDDSVPQTLDIDRDRCCFKDVDGTVLTGMLALTGSISTDSTKRQPIVINFFAYGHQMETWQGTYEVTNDQFTARFEAATVHGGRLGQPAVEHRLRKWSGVYHRLSTQPGDTSLLERNLVPKAADNPSKQEPAPRQPTNGIDR